MARPVRPQKTGAPKGAPVDDLTILHPERELVIHGREITVREYSFIEGARLARQIGTLTEALHHLIADASVPPGFDAISAVLMDNIDVVIELVCIAADVDREWMEQLSDQDGDLLMVTWWQVNAHFFIRRILRKAAQDRVARQLAGRTSTPPSSAPATDEPPPTSADSPAGS